MRRIVHIGLGNFHRAHQAWWTEAVADPADPWQITAYSGRSHELVSRLTSQGGRYTLVERAADGDRFQLIRAITEAVDGADTDHLGRRLADPATRVVTLTVTEAGYHLRADGRLDLDAAPVQDDRAALSGGWAGGGAVRTPVGRLLLGLRARHEADAGPITVVPCDNVAGNGARLRAALLDLADAGPLANWIATSVSFVDTCVDRITPRTTDADLALVQAATGFADRAPVVTEPYRDWVLSGDFPGGRPAWERAGARFVADIEPWQRRKLYLLNGAHSLLAYAGLPRGYRTVAEAIADPDLAAQVGRWWDTVSALVPADGLAAYRRQLLERFANPAIRHELRQIAADAVPKLRVRVAEPALRLADPEPASAILAAWLGFAGRADVGAALAEIDPRLTGPVGLVASVHSALREARR
jgi:fructuronate reductase